MVAGADAQAEGDDVASTAGAPVAGKLDALTASINVTDNAWSG